MKAEAVGHLVSAVAGTEEPGDRPAKAFVRGAGDGVDGTAQCTDQGHSAYISGPQSPGALALPYIGLVSALRERRADGTNLAGTFGHKQTVVDLVGLGYQLLGDSLTGHGGMV